MRISESQLDDLHYRFLESYEGIVSSIVDNVSDPDAIRHCANQLQVLGEKLNVEVEHECYELKDQADEIERSYGGEEEDHYESWREASGGSITTLPEGVPPGAVILPVAHCWTSQQCHPT